MPPPVGKEGPDWPDWPDCPEELAVCSPWLPSGPWEGEPGDCWPWLELEELELEEDELEDDELDDDELELDEELEELEGGGGIDAVGGDGVEGCDCVVELGQPLSTKAIGSTASRAIVRRTASAGTAGRWS